MSHRWLLALGAVTLLGCPSEEPEPVESAPDIAIISTLGFGREEPEGQSVGFDLDGRVSGSDDAEGCGIEDLVHVETGVPGIDNSFAGLLPALEQAGAGPLEDLVQDSVYNGELLLLLEMDGLDKPSGECVDLRLSRALAPVRLGGDGEVLPGQTFERDLELPSAHVPCATFDGSALHGEDLEMRLTLNVFDEFIDLTLYDGVVEATVEEDGSLTGGVIAGGISVLELEATVGDLDGIGDQIPQLIGPLLDANADLDPTGFGSCQKLSVVLTFGAVGAYVFDD